MNILLFIHFVIAIFLVASILLQKTSVDGVSTLSGNNMSLVSTKSVNTFLTRTTITLAVLFFINSIILANYAVSVGEYNTKKQNYTNEKYNKDPASSSSKSEEENSASSEIQKRIQKKQQEDNVPSDIPSDNDKKSSNE
jgi:preprotein translocase subunit SecG